MTNVIQAGDESHFLLNSLAYFCISKPETHLRSNRLVTSIEITEYILSLSTITAFTLRVCNTNCTLNKHLNFF